MVGFLNSHWTREVEQAIRDAHDEEITRKVRAVYDHAMNCSVDWSTSNMDAALAVLADYLVRELPWLSPEARTLLNYCYIMV